MSTAYRLGMLTIERHTLILPEASRVLVCEDHRPTANYAGRAID
jgi:hypothetical protein